MQFRLRCARCRFPEALTIDTAEVCEIHRLIARLECLHQEVISSGVYNVSPIAPISVLGGAAGNTHLREMAQGSREAKDRFVVAIVHREKRVAAVSGSTVVPARPGVVLSVSA